MSEAFKDHFSQNSWAYRAFRPEYPDALFQWLADMAPARESALDCGCGSGQAAVALARHFRKVYGVDPSAGQIDNAVPAFGLTYLVAPAEATGLADASQDLIIAAQALHWFDLDRFYPEVRRVARNGAVFAALTYGLMSLSPEVDRLVDYFYHQVVGSYWPLERRHVESGYRTLPFPFRELISPPLAMTAEWRIEHLLGYLSTWSAVKEYKSQTGQDPLAGVTEELRKAWGDLDEVKAVSWPLAVRAGRID